MPRFPRGGKNRYWNTDNTERQKVSRPPGLRGKEIGLYYRDRARNDPNRKKEFGLNLNIPPAVLKKVFDDLKSISKIAKEQNINIAYSSPFNKSNVSHNEDNHESDLTKEDSKRLKLETPPNKDDSEDFVHFKIPSTQKKTDGRNLFLQKNSNQNESSSETKSVKQSWSEDPTDIRTALANYRNKKQSEATPVETVEEFIPLSSSSDKIPDLKQSKKTHKENLQSKETEIKKQIEDQNDFEVFNVQPGMSTSDSKFESVNKLQGVSYQVAISAQSNFKYGYQDIITGTFDEKLDDCLAMGKRTRITDLASLNESLFEEYHEMTNKSKYKKMLEFRQKLPTYKKRDVLLETINNNTVVVISGETGCGKSTQVPQLLLDHALSNKKGAHVKIVVTQPRRIAASSLAERVAEERAEKLGHSVGYAVRLERKEPRSRGSIVYWTTGILLNEMEINQSLSDISHLILDEVHERDCHIDFCMLVLKKILEKRNDLKVILMSATIDAERLSAYFNNCPMLHIEGLAYPVQDIYLEEILQLTGFRFKGSNSNMGKKGMEKEIKHKHEVFPWLQTMKKKLDKNVYNTLLDYRSEELSIELIVELIAYICRGEPGAILVFLPGLSDITNVLKSLEQSNQFPRSRYEIYPLHSKLPSLEQKRIFEKSPEGIRKIIVATNIAETSITIDDIVYVIDCGRLKLTGLKVEENVSTLQIEWVSKANLRQRRGRAGRVQPGICYHLMTSFRASILADRLAPELQRSNLLEPVLLIKRLRLGKAEDALKLVPDPPADTTIQWAVKHLRQIGALDSKECLTPLGWHIARLPVHPAAGKLLLLGALFGCLQRAAALAAVWGFKDPFVLVIGQEKKVDEAKRYLSGGEPSDHIAITEAILTWEKAGRDRRSFAYEHFLSNNTLELLSEMKHQFGDHLRQMGFLPSGDIRAHWENRNSNNLSLFKAIVAASLYPNVGNVKWHGLYASNVNKPVRILVRTPEEGRVEVHPSSVMAGSLVRHRLINPGANWLVYWLKQMSTKLYLLEVTVVNTLALLFFGELAVSQVDNCPEDCYISITTIKVRCKRSTADLLFELRALLDHVLASKVMVDSDRSTQHSKFEEQVLNAVIGLITAEDEQAESIDDDSLSDSDRESNHRSWRK